MESELFGHDKGAFTGAVGAKPGWFEAAHGGTLFLDEIGDLPPPVQVKLLRVLQEREVVRLGSRQAIPIDVRLIAATNVDLDQAVAAGRFREDLYYRLKVAVLALPPLRERTGDILPLARYFLDRYRHRLGAGRRPSCQPQAEHRLLEHSWPGNIRELENVIHSALLVTQGPQIEAAALQIGAAPVRAAEADHRRRSDQRSAARVAGAVRAEPAAPARADRGGADARGFPVLPPQPAADGAPAGHQPQHRARTPDGDRRDSRRIAQRGPGQPRRAQPGRPAAHLAPYSTRLGRTVQAHAGDEVAQDGHETLFGLRIDVQATAGQTFQVLVEEELATGHVARA